VQEVLRSKWGRLFHNWEKLKPSEVGYPDIGPEAPGIIRGTFKLIGMSLRILGTCIKEAPAVAVRRRRRAATR